MSQRLKLIKNIDQKSKDLVVGYIRGIITNVPLDINNMCILYYFLMDEWDRNCIHENIKLIDNDTIEMSGSYQSCNAFLTNKVKSGKHIWKFLLNNFKIKQDSEDKYCSRITIGIFNTNLCKHPPLEDHFTFAEIDNNNNIKHTDESDEDEWLGTESRTGYKYTFNNWDDIKKKDSLKEKDIMTISLDLDQLTLKFALNGNPVNDTKIKRATYRIGVNLFIAQDSVSLISYKNV